MNKFTLAVAGSLALAASATAQETVPYNGPVQYAGKYFAATGQFVPADQLRSINGVGAIQDPIYVNNAFGGSFFNQIAGGLGGTIVDEGRIPSTSSPDLIGTSDSYTITGFQIGYATDSPGAPLGAGVDLRVSIYESYAACADPAVSLPPIFTIDLTGLPGSTSGGISAFTFDVDLTGMEFCMNADGDGAYSDGVSDLFGWSLEVLAAGGSNTGALLASDDTVGAVGDGTIFSANPDPTVTPGIGLDTQDLWRNIDGAGASSCFFFGGAPFASYWFQLNADTAAGDCFGCGLGDDAFEDNDDCLSAIPVANNLVYPNLIADNADEDWYAVEVAAGSTFTATADFDGSVVDIDMSLLADDCSTGLDTSGTISDQEEVSFTNCGTTPVTVNVRVFAFNGSGCGEYSLTLAEAVVPDDAFEPNDDCATAAPIGTGTYNDLLTTGCSDQDYFSFSLADGEAVQADILFTDADGDLDLYLADAANTNCGSTTTGDWLVRGFSASDNETVVYTNTTGAAQDLILFVDGFNTDTNAYDLILCIGAGGLAEQFCAGEVNSSGSAATVCAVGSDVAADNDVTLAISGMPAGENGYFITSNGTNVVSPASSVGTICIADLASLGRYTGNVLTSDANGDASQVLDLTATPLSGSGNVTVMAGETRYWQFWYRDGSDNNFSNAICITFQ